jgi:hypothetical protein
MSARLIMFVPGPRQTPDAETSFVVSAPRSCSSPRPWFDAWINDQSAHGRTVLDAIPGRWPLLERLHALDRNETRVGSVLLVNLTGVPCPVHAVSPTAFIRRQGGRSASARRKTGADLLESMDRTRYAKPGGLSDNSLEPRISPWMPSTYAVRLQTATASGRPVLLRVDDLGGHGGSTAE